MYQGCKRCGKGSHPRQTCPARDVACFCCNRRGHYSSHCLSNTVAELTQNLSELTAHSGDPYPETFDKYLNTVESARKEMWIIAIKINGQPVLVKVDTHSLIGFDMEFLKYCYTIGESRDITLRSWPETTKGFRAEVSHHHLPRTILQSEHLHCQRLEEQSPGFTSY